MPLCAQVADYTKQNEWRRGTQIPESILLLQQHQRAPLSEDSDQNSSPWLYQPAAITFSVFSLNIPHVSHPLAKWGPVIPTSSVLPLYALVITVPSFWDASTQLHAHDSTPQSQPSTITQNLPFPKSSLNSQSPISLLRNSFLWIPTAFYVTGSRSHHASPQISPVLRCFRGPCCLNCHWGRQPFVVSGHRTWTQPNYDFLHV